MLETNAMDNTRPARRRGTGPFRISPREALQLGQQFRREVGAYPDGNYSDTLEMAFAAIADYEARKRAQ